MKSLSLEEYCCKVVVFMKYIIAGIALGLLNLAAIKVKVTASSEVGLRMEFSNIKDTFSRHLVKYIGDCPGEYSSGIAENGDLRFISFTTEPNRPLKVSLTNLRSGKRIERDYKKIGLGSNDFNLNQLGNDDGSHEVEYAIYHKDTKESLETGTFNYNVSVSKETKERNAYRKIELYCASDEEEKLKKCKSVRSREVKYCPDGRNSQVRDLGIVDLNYRKVEIDVNRH